MRRKEVVGCVQSVVVKTKFQFQFEDGDRRERITCLILLVGAK